MLFEAARHEPLQARAWDDARAREAIEAIVADTQHALGSAIVWPWHPLDQKTPTSVEHKTVYLGSAGVLGALAYLQREGAAQLRIDPAGLVDRMHREYLLRPDTRQPVLGFSLGEAGVLLVHWRLSGSQAAADRLHDRVENNIRNPSNEAMWAAPGTMLAALWMFEWTGEARWKELYLRNVDHVWGLWRRSEHAPCDVWTQDLYGEIVQLLGAGHGFAGNIYPLLRGAALLDHARRESLYDRVAETYAATALVEGDAANWLPHVGMPREGREDILVQWCHGAPGMVTSCTPDPSGRSPALEALLLKAGNLTWQAGPLDKGYGLCHGTAGNGYAFLALHARTGDAVWLERARAFAMHAIEQAGRMRAQYGRGRYSLWTGDAGLAVYLWHCVKGEGGLPSLDVL